MFVERIVGRSSWVPTIQLFVFPHSHSCQGLTLAIKSAGTSRRRQPTCQLKPAINRQLTPPSDFLAVALHISRKVLPTQQLGHVPVYIAWVPSAVISTVRTLEDVSKQRKTFWAYIHSLFFLSHFRFRFLSCFTFVFLSRPVVSVMLLKKLQLARSSCQNTYPNYAECLCHHIGYLVPV